MTSAMHEFPCKQDENHLTTGDALPPLRFLAHRPPCLPLAHVQFYTSALCTAQPCHKPGLATLVNGIQCPLREKIILCPTVSSKKSSGNIKDGGLEGIPQLFRIPQSTWTTKIPTQPVCQLLSCPLILELATIWDGTILTDLSCNFSVDTTSLWSVLRN